MRVNALYVATALALVAGFRCSPLSAQPVLSPQLVWGPVSDGMRMAISPVKPGAVTQHEALFDVTFQNVGSELRVLNLGMMVGNGTQLYPVGIQVTLTNSGGSVIEVPFMDVHLTIKGRVDDYSVSLAAGATYVLRFDLDRKCCRTSALSLHAGRYRIAASFEGKGPQGFLWLIGGSTGTAPQSARTGAAPVNFWIGSIRSNTVEFDITDEAR